VVRNNFIVAGAGQGIEICRTRDTVVERNSIFCARPGQHAVQFHQLAGAGNRFLNNLFSGASTVPGDVEASGNVSDATAEWFNLPQAGDLRLVRKAAAKEAGAQAGPLR
jgi:hypothetical protein